MSERDAPTEMPRRDAGFSATNIYFENVTTNCVVRDLPAFWNTSEKTILNGVCGEFRSGQLTAIMGPSGCGKTSLLNVLAGYERKRNTNAGGEAKVEFGGERSRCYILQNNEDCLQPYLTVGEAVAFALKLRTSSRRSQSPSKINLILEEMSLSRKVDTLTKNLSGGEKKRLSIAVELVIDPDVMLFDEPTSGLDSSTSGQCIRLLRKLATANGKTIVCAIHQPSALALAMFHRLYVLSHDGRTIYIGTPQNLVHFLEANGVPCPTRHNPSDHVLDLICSDGDADVIDRLAHSINRGRCQSWLTNDGAQSPSSLCEGGEKRKGDGNDALRVTNVPLVEEIWILLERNMLTMKRNVFLTHLKLLTNLVSGVALGNFFAGIGSDASRTRVNFNMLFFCLMFVTFNALSSRIITFPSDIRIVKMEYFNRWYSSLSYFISSSIADIPVQLSCVLLFCIPIYWLTGQPRDLSRFAQFICAFVIIALLFQEYGILIGTLMNVQNGLIVGMSSIFPWVMFAGFFVQKRDTLPSFRWIFDVSILRRALELVVFAMYADNRGVMHCSEEFEICPFRVPDDFVKAVDMEDTSVSQNTLFLFCVYVAVKLCAYFAMRRKIFRSL